MSKEQEDLVMASNASTTVITVRTVAGVRPWAMMKADEEGKNISQFFSLAMVYMMNHDISPRDINSAIKSLKRLQEVEAELDQEREEHEKAVKAWREAMKGISQLSTKINQLESDLEASRASKASVEGDMTKKHKELTHAAKKHVEDAEKRYKALEDRLTKANECLEKHGVTDGLFSNKVLQF